MVHNVGPEGGVRDSDNGGRNVLGGEDQGDNRPGYSGIPEISFPHDTTLMMRRFVGYYEAATDKAYAIAQLRKNLQLLGPVERQQVLLQLPSELIQEIIKV